MCFGAAVAMAEQLCVRAEFLGIENESIFINLLPVISYGAFPECFLF